MSPTVAKIAQGLPFQVMSVSEVDRERETKIEPNGVSDDRRWELMADK